MRRFDVFRILQNRKELFVGVLRVSDVLDVRTEVDFWTSAWRPGGGKGYQRLLSEQKLRNIVTFLTKNKGIMPNSIMVGIRSQVKFIPQRGNLGTLLVPNEAKIYLVDGQHRIRGLERALKRRSAESALKGFAFPVVFLCPKLWNKNLKPDVEEGKQFVTVNKTQTGVKGDLVDAFVFSLASPNTLVPRYDLAGLPETILKEMGPRIRARATTVLLKRWFPWENLIRGPNEPRGNTLINEKAWVDSLVADVVSHPRFVSVRPGPISVRLTHYWEAILKFYPSARRNPKRFWVQKVLGMSVFNKIFPDVDAMTKGSKTPDAYKETLAKRARMPGAVFWSRKGRARIFGTSYSARSDLAKRIWR